MNRRDLIAALAAATVPGGAFAQGSTLRAAAQAAWLYGLPLIEMATTRARALTGRGGMAGAVNRFVHTRALAGPASRGVTAPNNDTLYSSAWLDLTRGPVTLTIPETGARYISVAGMNFYTDNDFVLGTRTSGGAGGVFTIVGPGQAGSGAQDAPRHRPSQGQRRAAPPPRLSHSTGSRRAQQIEAFLPMVQSSPPQPQPQRVLPLPPAKSRCAAALPHR